MSLGRSRAKGVALAVGLLCGSSCGNRERVEVVHPAGDSTPRKLFRVAMTQRITLPDNFVMRPDEFAAVTVDADRQQLYVGSREGTLLALDELTGQVLWEHELGGAVASRPALTWLPGDPKSGPGKTPPDVLLVGTDNGEMVAIDLGNHELLWRYQTDGKIRNNAVTFEGVVYVVNSRDQVFALDLRSGSWRWQYEQELQTDFTISGRAGLTFVPREEQSVDEPGTIYTGFDNGKVVAIGAGSGEALWIASVAPQEGRDFIDCDSTPLLVGQGRSLVVSGQSTGVHSLSTEDGSVEWMFPVRAASTLVAGRGNDVYGASSLEGVFSLDGTGRLLWRTQVDPGVVSVPVVVEDVVYVTHSDSGLLAFDADSGEFLARIDPGSGMSSVPVYHPPSRRFYATTNRGLLLGLEIDARDPQPLNL